MGDKGETSEKSHPRTRRERRDSQDTSNMSMKVNVMYRGIVYRVRGIKVLCSVITAVILLLVTIVGLGIWMLVSAYAEEKSELFSDNRNTTTSPLPQDMDGRGTEVIPIVVSIDFDAPSVTLDELTVPASIPSTHPNEDMAVNEAIGHFQGATPNKELRASSRSPGPDPPFGLFSGFLDLGIDNSKESSTLEYITISRVTSDWTPMVTGLPTDSMVELSENRPVAVTPPTDLYRDYGEEPLHGYIRNSNSERYPYYEENPSHIPDVPLPDLPEDFPRDIDPTLIGFDVPFPFPPSITPVPPHLRSLNLRPGLRRNNQRQRLGFQRVPPGIRRGQPPGKPVTPRLPYYYRSSPSYDQLQDYKPQTIEEQQSYDQYVVQKQGPNPQDKLPTEQPSTVREAPTNPYESSISLNTPVYSILQQYSANIGGKLPNGVTLPPGFTFPADTENIRWPGNDTQGWRPQVPRFHEDMMYYYNKHERQRKPSSTSAPTDDSEYSQRKGLSAQEGNSSVTGSSAAVHEENPNPQQQPTASVFEHFWDLYDSNGKPPAQHEDRGPVPEESLAFAPISHSQMLPQPNVRGSQPNGQGYPIRIRPDAEGPDRMLLVSPNQPPRRQQVVRRPVSPRPPPPPNQHRPILGPLYDIYQYSQRLAATLLNFPSNILTQVDDSRAEYMQNEVALLEDYNKIFQHSNVTSADVLPDMFDDRPDRGERLMLLDAEKIRSLNPFELSLITWTFLDFWEFLIEKVGTLSKEDLQHLETRLDRLRQEKDHRMAKNIVAATVNYISKDSSQNQPDRSQIITMTEELLRSTPDLGDISRDDSSPGQVQGRMWDPLGLFSSEQRIKFMEFAIKILFKFGRVYLRKQYALDCMMLLFCKDLNTNSKKEGMDAMAAKVKSVGLKVLTQRENRHLDTIGEVWRAMTAWETLQCEPMFPKCDGPKALEIVNEVAIGTRK